MKMKKILIVAICILLAGMSIATALPISSNTNLKLQTPDIIKPGVNSGEISTPQSDESTPITQTPDTSKPDVDSGESSTPQSDESAPITQTPDPIVTGTFVGELSAKPPKNWEKVGDISGSLTKNKFQGNWNTDKSSGTIQFSFGRHILIGKIITAGKTIPIVGFYKFDEAAKTFTGRFMSFVGPALYFKGTYT
jgi:hypothetical protein